jgi:hypothetical protein
MVVAHQLMKLALVNGIKIIKVYGDSQLIVIWLSFKNSGEAAIISSLGTKGHQISFHIQGNLFPTCLQRIKQRSGQNSRGSNLGRTADFVGVEGE